MSQFIPDIAKVQSNLKDKVIVTSGGASGIGAATVRRIHHHGGIAVFGDVSTSAGEDLARELHTDVSKGPLYVPCDISNYSSVYKLFTTALDTYGRVDHAIACAGILEKGKWFDPDLTVESVAEEETRAVLDVNVLGTCFFARIAVVFLRESMKKTGVKRDGSSLELIASVASLRESAGLYMYQTSKHAVLGLLRSMRTTIHDRDGIRVNCVCPGMTDSGMTAHLIERFQTKGGITQPSSAVAEIILGAAANESVHGRAFYVEGSRGWEFEESFVREMPAWLGEEPTRDLRRNAELVAKGALLN